LNFLRSEATNIMTVEDPIEYRIAGVNQVAVTPKTGLTFAAGLRSILRQDPDVVMVGEIRDLETAQVVFQAAQTGHLVLSTLHTNDAASAITRLADMGEPTYVIASSLLSVLAQRLVRRLCQCKETRPDGTASAKGCESCRYLGFKGRLGVYELLPVTSRVRSVILARGSDDVVRDAARAAGMKSMFQDGERKVAGGLTVMDEVQRVAPPDESHDPDAMPAVPEPLSPAVRTAGPPKILVVDDEPTLLEIIQEVLGSEHYEVFVARNGQEALAQVYREKPDLILTDLQMPGMDGMELLKRLRSDLSTCQIPVIFLTVVDALDTEAQAMDLGADDYVTKPFQRGRLLSRIRRSLYRAHLGRTAS
jgi:CheY-like chemotaxis protein